MRLGRVKLVFTTFSAAFLIFHQLSSSTRTKVHDLKSTVAANIFFRKSFSPALCDHFNDELEEHQAYGDSTLGCNEATEQHKEQSGVRRNAARWR